MDLATLSDRRLFCVYWHAPPPPVVVLVIMIILVIVTYFICSSIEPLLIEHIVSNIDG